MPDIDPPLIVLAVVLLVFFVQGSYFWHLMRRRKNPNAKIVVSILVSFGVTAIAALTVGSGIAMMDR